MTEPHAASGVSSWGVVSMYAGFGALFTMHFTLQATVLVKEGAMAVGMVNAFRAALVSVVSGLIFCSIDTAHQCLTWHTASSAAVVTAGAMLWVVSKAEGGRSDDSLSRQGSHSNLKRA